MERNFFRRVEVAFPIERPIHRERILRDLDICLRDNAQAWILNSQGRYERTVPPANERAVSVQAELLSRYGIGLAFTAS